MKKKKKKKNTISVNYVSGQRMLRRPWLEYEGTGQILQRQKSDSTDM